MRGFLPERHCYSITVPVLRYIDFTLPLSLYSPRLHGQMIGISVRARPHAEDSHSSPKQRRMAIICKTPQADG